MAGSGLPPAEEVLCFGHRLWRSGGRDGSQSFRRLLASYSAVIVVGRARASAPCSSDNHTLIIAPTACSASLQGKAAPVISKHNDLFLLANITSCISAFYYEISHNDCKLWGKNEANYPCRFWIPLLTEKLVTVICWLGRQKWRRLCSWTLIRWKTNIWFYLFIPDRSPL